MRLKYLWWLLQGRQGVIGPDLPRRLRAVAAVLAVRTVSVPLPITVETLVEDDDLGWGLELGLGLRLV